MTDDLIDECAPACQAPRVRLACPRNGEPVQCLVCDGVHRHRVELLVPAAARPRCPGHDVPLVQEA